MQGIYTHIPETNYVPREYSVAAILLFLFMVLISLVSVLNLLYFYISTFRSMGAVPNMAVFCSSLTSWFPGMLLTYFLNDFEIVPVAPIIMIMIIVVIIIIIIVIVIISKWDFPVYGCCTLLMTWQIYHCNSIIVAISVHQFQIIGLKISSLPTFALKSHNRVCHLVYRELIEFLTHIHLFIL